MKFLKYVIILLFIVPNVLNAKPQVYFDYKVYFTPMKISYVETLLQFSSVSLKYLANENGNLESSLEVTQIFKIGDSIVLADKYIINSPEMIDSTIEDYYDVKRFQLPVGDYNYELIITDLNNKETVSGKLNVVVNTCSQNEVSFSSIGFIQSAAKSTEKSYFVKNGYFILPYLTNYFPPVNNKIATYFELYNTQLLLGDGEKFLITFEIENFKTGKKIEDAFKFQKLTTSEVVPVLSFMSIETLPSGEYNFVVSLIDKNNIILKTEKLYFQRRSDIIVPSSVSIENLDIANSFTNDIDYDSIPFYLNSLMPISERMDDDAILSLLKSRDTVSMQKYFHSFWVLTAPLNAYEGWLKYKEQVMYCEAIFGTQIKHGFETDRGRVFLQYGAPNDLQDIKHDHTTVPYQIWHYYRIGQRSNIRYVFYNPDLVTNDYPLLHSNMQGELQNTNWQEYLQDYANPDRNLDPNIKSTDKDAIYDSNSGRYFNN
jgi:GWxTD domain-containing protein